jgi:hypothetical protein
MTRIYKRRREDALPTPRTALRTRYVRVLVFCNSCRHQADADLRALVLRGQGDVPLTELRFRCSSCGTDRTDFVVTSRQPAAVVSGRETEDPAGLSSERPSVSGR